MVSSENTLLTKRTLALSSSATLTTLSRGLAILEFVANAEKLVRLRDVSAHFDMDRSAALRFLRTLEADGYIVRHAAMKVYSLGPKILSFPRLASDVEHVIAAARPVLDKLGRATSQVAHLATLSGKQAVLVEVVASDAPVAVKQAVGDLEPLYSSAVGKALYAFMSSDDRRRLAGSIEFESFTSRTLSSVAALNREADAIRERGVSFDRQEGNEHISCIGAPILTPDGNAIAAIGLSYVTAHLPHAIDDMTDHIDLIQDAAAAVERALATQALPAVASQNA